MKILVLLMFLAGTQAFSSDSPEVDTKRLFDYACLLNARGLQDCLEEPFKIETFCSRVLRLTMQCEQVSTAQEQNKLLERQNKLLEEQNRLIKGSRF